MKKVQEEQRREASQERPAAAVNEPRSEHGFHSTTPHQPFHPQTPVNQTPVNAPTHTPYSVPSAPSHPSIASAETAPRFTTTYPAYPHNPANPLDNTLPRGLLYKLIDLHFEYIYPLTPILHRPSFLADLRCRREEQPGEEEWTAMVLSVIGVTVAQLPAPLVPMSKEEARHLVHMCYSHVKGWQMKEVETFTVTRGEFGQSLYPVTTKLTAQGSCCTLSSSSLRSWATSSPQPQSEVY